MDNATEEKVWIDGPGKATCPKCGQASYRKLFDHVQVDVCEPHLDQLRRMGEEHPERIIGYNAGERKFFYTIGVKPGWDDQGLPGDRNRAYVFGLPMPEERFGGWRSKARLMQLRSDLQDRRVDAHLNANPDGF